MNPIVDNVSLDLFKGETCIILGHSGAGKTTLLNMLVGKSKITGGIAQINQYAVEEEMEEILRNEKIGYFSSKEYGLI